jgi:hypothetical protein
MYRLASFSLLLAPFMYAGSALAQVAEPPAPAPSSPPAPSHEPPPSAETSLVPWGFWFGIGYGKVWGDPIPASGITGPGGAFSMSLDFSYRFLYAGAGFSIVSFHDNDSFTQLVRNQYGQSAEVESSSASGAGFVEAGLVHRFLIPTEKNGGIGIQPAVGYGIEGITAPNRTISHCIDCGGETVGDYHGGQYVRFQLGIYLAAKGPTSTMYGYVGLSPSFQYFVVKTDPGMTSALDIALSVGFAR